MTSNEEELFSDSILILRGLVKSVLGSFRMVVGDLSILARGLSVKFASGVGFVGTVAGTPFGLNRSWGFRPRESRGSLLVLAWICCSLSSSPISGFKIIAIVSLETIFTQIVSW